MSLSNTPADEPESFEAVTARLNTVELVNEYAMQHLTYTDKKHRSIQTPQMTFESGEGVCRHYAAFATYCLRKAGYDVRNLTYWWKNPEMKLFGHSVSVLGQVRDGKQEYIVVMNSGRLGEMTGPYDDYPSIATDLAPFTVTKWMVEDNEALIARNRSAFES